jgi:hypothetical protein
MMSTLGEGSEGLRDLELELLSRIGELERIEGSAL